MLALICYEAYLFLFIHLQTILPNSTSTHHCHQYVRTISSLGVLLAFSWSAWLSGLTPGLLGWLQQPLTPWLLPLSHLGPALLRIRLVRLMKTTSLTPSVEWKILENVKRCAATPSTAQTPTLAQTVSPSTTTASSSTTAKTRASAATVWRRLSFALRRAAVTSRVCLEKRTLSTFSLKSNPRPSASFSAAKTRDVPSTPTLIVLRRPISETSASWHQESKTHFTLVTIARVVIQTAIVIQPL